jgi:hypothetical protein
MNRKLVHVLWLLIAASAMADGLPQGQLPESTSADVGYKTVADALAALYKLKSASFSTVRGWTIVTDEPHFTVWSFAPRSDPSYPSVVKRFVTSSGSGSIVTTRILCESDKAACDNLVREFHNMNFRGSGAQVAH